MIHAFENDYLNLTGKTQSISMLYGTLQMVQKDYLKKIHTAEIDKIC